MTNVDRMKVLNAAVEEFGQAEVARRIGKSSAAVSQVRSGTYQGKPDRILELVDAEFGSAEIDCPVMGRVPLARCIEERTKPFRATNPQRRQLYQACQRCPHKE